MGAWPPSLSHSYDEAMKCEPVASYVEVFLYNQLLAIIGSGLTQCIGAFWNEILKLIPFRGIDLCNIIGTSK